MTQSDAPDGPLEEGAAPSDVAEPGDEPAEGGDVVEVTDEAKNEIESVGADRVLFASDYPHWDATFPGVTKMILDRTDMSAATKRKVMGENAARLLRLDY